MGLEHLATESQYRKAPLLLGLSAITTSIFRIKYQSIGDGRFIKFTGAPFGKFGATFLSLFNCSD